MNHDLNPDKYQSQSSIPSSHDALSGTGQQRRDQMLPHLQSAMQTWHRRRRRNQRTALAIVPLLILALGTIWWKTSFAPPTRHLNPVAIDIVSPLAPAPSIPVIASPAEILIPRQVLIVDRIATDPDILNRFAIDDRASIEIIDDDSLLALLTDLNRPTGLITTGGEIRLTRNVADPLAPSPLLAPPDSPGS